MKAYDAVLLIVVGGAGLIYRLLEVFKPSLPIRWQVRSTAKARGLKKVVGLAFQRMLRIDASAEPWDDPRAKRSVRWVGLANIVWSSLALVGGFVLWTR